MAHIWTDMPRPPGQTPHTCFHLYLFWSHYRTHSLSHALGTVAVGAAPLTSCHGHLQVGTVAAGQLHALVPCAATGPGVSQEGHHQSQEELGTCPYQNPRPNVLQIRTCSYWIYLVTVLSLSQGSYTSLLEIQATVHIPHRTFQVGKYPCRMGCGAVPGYMHTP